MLQTKYLGRQWRKSNMKTMSAIYAKVRHRLNDDWAYGNGERGGAPKPSVWSTSDILRPLFALLLHAQVSRKILIFPYACTGKFS